MLIDTHCHIHESGYPLDADKVIERAYANGVGKIICNGGSMQSSREAVAFAASRDNVYATVGVHPHHAKDGLEGFEELVDKSNPKIVAVGEIGLDYHYDNSSREDQIKVLGQQIELALKYDLPMVFHVREAFDDFWPIFDSYSGIRGELHGFTDTIENARKGIERGLYLGVNGISTFTKDKKQQQMYAEIPLNKILLETDAPYLTPVPFRGNVNEPAFVKNVAVFGGESRYISEKAITEATTANAKALFNLKYK